MIHILDIGDDPIDAPGYQTAPGCKISGFDARSGIALGDGKEYLLHVCRLPGLTSLLVPNREVLESFGLSGEVTAVVPVQTHRLDDVWKGPVDLLKLDIQGSELMVLRHGYAVLERCAAVHIELSFTQLYHDQPPYYLVDAFLRDFGFLPALLIQYQQGAPGLLEMDWLYTKRDDPRVQEIRRVCYGAPE